MASPARGAGRLVRGVGPIGDMHRFSTIDVLALVLAALFLVGGLACVVHPTKMAWAHPTMSPASARPETYIEVVSKEGARVYGGLGVVLGIGLALFVFFPLRK
jgi:hypothetical protein